MTRAPVAVGDSSHCYLQAMKQMITRVSESLHALARDEAARRGQSLNDFVIDAIVVALGDALQGNATESAQSIRQNFHTRIRLAEQVV